MHILIKQRDSQPSSFRNSYASLRTTQETCGNLTIDQSAVNGHAAKCMGVENYQSVVVHGSHALLHQ